MTLVSRIESGVEYKGYIVKWDEDQVITQHRAKSIYLTNTETGETNVYRSLLEAEYQSKICRATLRKYANINGVYKGLIISYTN
jgi:hypothetical protein